MGNIYITSNPERIIYALLVVPIFGVFFSLAFLNFFYSIIYISLGFVFYLVGLHFFRKCIPYVVELGNRGIKLYYKKICDGTLRALYKRKDETTKGKYMLEINRDEGWIEIKWENIKDIWVGRGYIEPRCRIEMVNGDRVYLLNPVDRKILNHIIKAWGSWRNESVKTLK